MELLPGLSARGSDQTVGLLPISAEPVPVGRFSSLLSDLVPGEGAEPAGTVPALSPGSEAVPDEGMGEDQPAGPEMLAGAQLPIVEDVRHPQLAVLMQWQALSAPEGFAGEVGRADSVTPETAGLAPADDGHGEQDGRLGDALSAPPIVLSLFGAAGVPRAVVEVMTTPGTADQAMGSAPKAATLSRPEAALPVAAAVRVSAGPMPVLPLAQTTPGKEMQGAAAEPDLAGLEALQSRRIPMAPALARAPAASGSGTLPVALPAGDAGSERPTGGAAPGPDTKGLALQSPVADTAPALLLPVLPEGLPQARPSPPAALPLPAAASPPALPPVVPLDEGQGAALNANGSPLALAVDGPSGSVRLSVSGSLAALDVALAVPEDTLPLARTRSDELSRSLADQGIRVAALSLASSATDARPEGDAVTGRSAGFADGRSQGETQARAPRPPRLADVSAAPDPAPSLPRAAERFA